MEYRTYRGERLSEVGLGCYGVGGAYGAKDPDQFVGLFRRAVELGVTFFDTADVYGPGEQVLGRALAPFRDRVWIATKVGASEGGKPDCSRAHIVAACEQSLRRLGVEQIDLYQIHFDDPQTPVAETVGALDELAAAGKIRYYGVGHLSPGRVAEYLVAGHVFSMLIELSAVARGALERTAPLCRAHGVGLIAFSVTGRGLLTGAIGPDTAFGADDIRRLDPLFQRARRASGLRIAGEMRKLGERYGKSPVQVAIAWVLAHPNVVCALTGPSTVVHLEENLGGSGWTIHADDLAALDCLLKAEDERLRREQVAELCAILEGEPLPEQAFTDLVYVLETLVELGLAEEQQVMPAFRQLWVLRADPDPTELARIHAGLQEQFLPVVKDRSSDDSPPGRSQRGRR
ncbi:MAG TPA: aldo/keto reductase [Phycisphaerales bacterium]|nr:aldo/keto reductase [Phycisphaerales bacterium]